MTSSRKTRLSEFVNQRFVGRKKVLDIFYLRLASRHMKNGVYYYGAGGLGKTWILQKIQLSYQNKPTSVVTEIIDFFETQHHNIRGLQATLKSCLQAPEAFRPYEETLNRLATLRSKGQEEVHPSTITSLEAHADRQFIECCQEATGDKVVILLFDTFERVQHQYVGQWLIEQFLPEVRGNLIIAIAGRPSPVPAQMPDNIVSYELKGLDLEETTEYILNRLQKRVSEEDIHNVWTHTNGRPLFIDLIFNLPIVEREQFIDELDNLNDSKKIPDSPDLLQRLIGQFAEAKRENWVLWTMACLKRRFDLPMLEYIIKNGEMFNPGDYNRIFDELGRSIYVKEYPEQQSHLLHDEIQSLVAQYILPQAFPGIHDSIYELIVNQYYPETIKSATPELTRQMQAERLGYLLDRDSAAGVEKYKIFRDKIETTYEYDFEELLWGEVREHIDKSDDAKRYQICAERGQFLRRHSLFKKAEKHYRQMLDLFEDQRIGISQSLGFMVMRQGNISEAKTVFEDSLKLVKEKDFEKIAMIENNLAQAAIASGDWDQAIVHYAHCFRAASLVSDYEHMCGVYIGRGYLYALQGLYSYARKQCELAIELTESLPDNPANAQRGMYAWMNLGTSHRYAGDYPGAEAHYEKSLELARKINHREGSCHALQHIGINEYLRGRLLLQKQENLTTACEYQLKAWKHLTEALKIAQESDWRGAIAHGLHRLAHVYNEIDNLQTLSANATSPEFEAALHSLQQESQTLQMPFGIEYGYELLMPIEFVQLTLQEKAAWLFEVSALLADEVNDFHLALDSLTELARMLLQLDLEDEVQIIMRRIERIKGSDYQEELFTAISDITLADLAFKQQKFDAALGRYKKAYASLAKQSGYASYLLTARLKGLELLIRSLSSDTAQEWCDVLETEWLDQSISTVRPDMFGLIEKIRLDILAQT